MEDIMFKAYFIILVVILLLGLIYLVTKKKISTNNVKHNKVYILESINVGSKEKIALIKVNNKRLLIGITASNISKLADIELESKFSIDLNNQINNKKDLKNQIDREEYEKIHK